MFVLGPYFLLFFIEYYFKFKLRSWFINFFGEFLNSCGAFGSDWRFFSICFSLRLPPSRLLCENESPLLPFSSSSMFRYRCMCSPSQQQQAIGMFKENLDEASKSNRSQKKNPSLRLFAKSYVSCCILDFCGFLISVFSSFDFLFIMLSQIRSLSSNSCNAKIQYIGNTKAEFTWSTYG